MADDPPPPLLAAIDRWARDDWEAAARGALLLLASDPEHAAAGVVLVEVLRGQGRDIGQAGPRLSDRFLRRRDLPAATHAALVGGDPHAALGRVAEVFGDGSSSLVRGAPPPLPAPVKDADGEEPLLRGDALLDAAEDALANLIELADTAPAGLAAPAHPLFSSIPPADLAALLARFTPRSFGDGQIIVTQGDDGASAFVLVRGVVEVSRSASDGAGEELSLAELGPGAIFGELALVAETPRGATVRAVGACQLLEVERSALDGLSSKHVADAFVAFTRSRLIDHLVHSSALFAGLTPDELQTLVGRFETQAYQVGDTVLQRGDEGNALHLVASGFLRVYGADDAGADVELGRVGPGEVVGEMSLVLRRPVGADVVAETSVVTLSLSRDDFEEIARAHPTLLRDLFEVASARDVLTRKLLEEPTRHPDDIVVV